MTSIMFQEPHIVEPRSKHTHTVIMLHGRGGTGPETAENFLTLLSSSNTELRDVLPGYKWVFPSCPPRMSIVFHEELTQWYDIYSLTSTEAQVEIQYDGMTASVQYLKALIEEERKTSPTGDIILGGISQGFNVAILTALLDTNHIRAMFGFCSWLPFQSNLQKLGQDVVNDKITATHAREVIAHDVMSRLDLPPNPSAKHDLLPILLTHSADDRVVELAHGQAMKETLIELGYPVTWHEFTDGGHWIHEPLGIDSLLAFLEDKSI